MATDASERVLWRSTRGVEPCAVQAARTALNGREVATCSNVTRLVPTQLRRQVSLGVRRLSKQKFFANKYGSVHNISRGKSIQGVQRC